MNQDPSIQYQVISLHWDLATTLLAVGLTTAVTNTNSDTDNRNTVQYVQLYTRNNYRWYLKQQISGLDLFCLGFDSEISNKLYFSQRSVNSTTATATSTAVYLRTVDLSWDVCTSVHTADGSVAVIDGCQVLLTPLGISAVPPPMSLHQVVLTQACNSCAFWKYTCDCFMCHKQQQQQQQHCDASKAIWGLVCVSDNFSIQLIFGNYKGTPIVTATATATVTVDTIELLSQLQLIVNQSSQNVCKLESYNIFTRSVSCSPNNIKKEYINLYLLCYICGVGDYLICCSVHVASGQVSNVTCFNNNNNTTSDTNDDINIKCLVNTSNISCEYGAVALMNTTTSTYEVCFFDPGFNTNTTTNNNNNVKEFIKVGESVLLPEICYHVSLLANTNTESSTNNNDTESSYTSAPITNISQLQWTAVGLSSKGRLYCGEVLLVSGASSYTINPILDILLYTTVGTRPQLHYMSIAALVGLSSLHGQHTDIQYFLELGEARPVERGAKLIG